MKFLIIVVVGLLTGSVIASPVQLNARETVKPDPEWTGGRRDAQSSGPIITPDPDWFGGKRDLEKRPDYIGGKR